MKPEIVKAILESPANQRKPSDNLQRSCVWGEMDAVKGAPKKSASGPCSNFWTAITHEENLDTKVKLETVTAKLEEADHLWATKGQKSVAMKLYQETYALAKEAGSDKLQATVGMGLGYGLLELGLPGDAIEKFAFAYGVAKKNANAVQANAAKQFLNIALQNVERVEGLRLLAAARTERKGSEGESSVTTEETGSPMHAAVEEQRVCNECIGFGDTQKQWSHGNDSSTTAAADADRHMEELLAEETEQPETRMKRKHKQKLRKKAFKMQATAEAQAAAELAQMQAAAEAQAAEVSRRVAQQSFEVSEEPDSEPEAEGSLLQKVEVGLGLGGTHLTRDLLLRHRLYHSSTSPSEFMAQAEPFVSNLSEPVHVRLPEEDLAPAGAGMTARAQSNSIAPGLAEQKDEAGDMRGLLESHHVASKDCQDHALKSVSSMATCDISDSQSDASTGPNSTSDMDAIPPPPGLPPPPPPGLEADLEVALVPIPSWICSQKFEPSRHYIQSEPRYVKLCGKMRPKNITPPKIRIPQFCPYCGIGLRGSNSCHSCGSSFAWMPMM